MDHIPSPHPLTPPQSEEDALAWLRLLRSRRVGPSTFLRLMAEHGSAQAALEALPEIARAAGAQHYRPCPYAVAETELRDGQFAGARLLALGAPDYPPMLAALDDPPPLVWAMGDPALAARPTVALVGARNASSLGLRMARRLAHELAEAGLVVVSGLARGIDTVAHETSLRRGTIAVMAGGVDVIYPRENTVLAEEIAREGLRLSEQPMGMSPQARHFPRRNRLISGLSQAVVVIEAAAKSGALITARDALDQGREVLAVPGHPFDARAAGCNMLLRDGATLVRGATDVLEAIAVCAPAPAPARTPLPSAAPAAPPARRAPAQSAAASPTPDRRSPAETRALHQQILARLGPSPLPEDQLIRDLGAPAPKVAAELLALELEGHIRRHPGGLLAREA